MMKEANNEKIGEEREKVNKVQGEKTVAKKMRGINTFCMHFRDNRNYIRQDHILKVLTPKIQPHDILSIIIDSKKQQVLVKVRDSTLFYTAMTQYSHRPEIRITNGSDESCLVVYDLPLELPNEEVINGLKDYGTVREITRIESEQHIYTGKTLVFIQMEKPVPESITIDGEDFNIIQSF